LPGSKKILKQFRRKDNSDLLGVFHICLPGDSKEHFDSAVTKLPSLSIPRTRYVFGTCCAVRLTVATQPTFDKFANQEARSLLDLPAPLQILEIFNSLTCPANRKNNLQVWWS